MPQLAAQRGLCELDLHGAVLKSKFTDLRSRARGLELAVRSVHDRRQLFRVETDGRPVTGGDARLSITFQKFDTGQGALRSKFHNDRALGRLPSNATKVREPQDKGCKRGCTAGTSTVCRRGTEAT
jgi:hypothetical protein